MKVAPYLLLLTVALLPRYVEPQHCVQSSRQLTVNIPEGGPSCSVSLNQRQSYCENFGMACESLHEARTRNNSWFLYIRHCRPSGVSIVQGELSSAEILAVSGCRSYPTGMPLRYKFVNHSSCVCVRIKELHHAELCPYNAAECVFGTSGQ